MAGSATVAAALLAATFVAAAVAKLRSPQVTEATFVALGIPAARLAGRAVPLTELAVAALLATRPAVGAVLALVLLAAFTTVLARTLARGESVACGCFGSRRTAPVSMTEIARNGLLAALAVLATGATTPSAPALGDVIALTAAFAAGVVVLALLDVRRVAGGRLLRVDLGSAGDPADQGHS